MSQVLFAGNLAPYGTLTPAFLTSMAVQGIEPLVLNRYCNFPSEWYASKYNVAEQRLGTPISIKDINPTVIHAFFGRQMPDCNTMLHINLLTHQFKDAKFVVGMDGVQTDRIVLNSALLAANAVTIPHASIIDALVAAGMHDEAAAVHSLKSSGRLFEVKPGIDTNKFNPYTDNALGSNKFNASSPYDDNGRFNNSSPAQKKRLREITSDQHGLFYSRDTYTLFYGPDVSIPENLAQLESQVFFSEKTPMTGYNTFFVGSNSFVPEYIQDLKTRVFNHKEHHKVAYIHFANEAAYRSMLGGAFIGIFPPEAGEFGFASVPYVQRIIEAMRYGVMVAAAPAFERQGIVVPYINRPAKAPFAGIGFPAKDDSPEAFKDAEGQMWKQCFEYINGNHRFSEAVIGAMRVRGDVSDTVKRYLEIYNKISG